MGPGFSGAWRCWASPLGVRGSRPGCGGSARKLGSAPTGGNVLTYKFRIVSISTIFKKCAKIKCLEKKYNYEILSY